MNLLNHQLFLWIDEKPRSAVKNMAIDQTLFELKREENYLRFYAWEKQSISFGYSQRFKEVKTQYPQFSFYVRRLTGGGIVIHQNEWTYSLKISPYSKMMQISQQECYKLIHQKLSLALHLKEKQKKIFLNEKSFPSGFSCFQNPSLYDLFLETEKIAGAAQKRNEFLGILYQGSIKKHPLLAFCINTFAENLTSKIEKIEKMPQNFWDKVKNLEKQYSSKQWLKKR